MLVRMFLVLGFVFFCYCSSDEGKKPEEVVTPQKAEAVIPDSPGNAGEAEAAKKTEPPAIVEKSPAASKEIKEVKKETASSEFRFVSPSLLNVRSGPGMKFNVIRTITHNTKVPVLAKENDIWVKISDNEFCSGNYLSAAPTEKPAPVKTVAPAAAPKPEPEQKAVQEGTAAGQPTQENIPPPEQQGK